ncbi:hypothetical protein BO71DRAFT_445452 [Aspergillus ellipticus CBS 707.79]|uniref:Uncharacterized protein n=1 Tax=Aspergillus ellipticus CBS 707.79 TaxID=1448320 RepID=A0A319CTR8_9EURO|nr:hypothetical protein BO71DRAFT_445452 [Aspergillus ellipticus CBS 707.79]
MALMIIVWMRYSPHRPPQRWPQSCRTAGLAPGSSTASSAKQRPDGLLPECPPKAAAISNEQPHPQTVSIQATTHINKAPEITPQKITHTNDEMANFRETPRRVANLGGDYDQMGDLVIEAET